MIATLFNALPFAAEEAAGEDGGSFLVTPGVGLMLSTLLVFGGSMYLLAKLAFPRIQEALDKRQRLIEDSIDSAERTKREADQLLAEYRDRLRDAREQADEIVARARKTGEDAESESMVEAKTKREEMMAATRKEIEAETRRAISEIRNEVADMTILATEKVTGKSMTGADQKRLVEEAIAELDFSALADDRRN